MNRRLFLTNPLELGTQTKSRKGNKSNDPARNVVKNSKRGGPTVPRVLAGLEPYSGPWGDDQVRHLLRRTLFGFKKADMDAVNGKNMSQILDMLLADLPAPNPPLVYPKTDGSIQQGNTWVNSTYSSTTDDQRNESLTAWWISQMLSQGVSLQEKMTLFWHNHFATGAATVKDARYMYKQNSLLRQNAFGNFKELVRAITFDPAMLRYLNGNTNKKGSINENYGRELQELFSIGKGPEISVGNYTNYTEDDVKAASRVLSGWTDVSDSVTARFSSENHDSTDKQFSTAYGNVLIKGATDEAGARREIDDLLNMIFQQTATAKYICRKLYRWFVYYDIDPYTETNVIEPMALLLMQSNYDMKPVLRAFFSSAHFYDPMNIGCLIKNPMDFTIGTMRMFETAIPTSGPNTIIPYYYGWIGMKRTIGTMAMTIMAPPNVAGWQPYYQAPAYHELWVNADSLQKRIKLITDLVTSGYQLPENSQKMLIDTTIAASNVSDPSNPDTLIDEWVKMALPIAITSDQRNTLMILLLGGQAAYNWTQAWNAYEADPTDTTKKATVTSRLAAVLGFLLKMPEYQLS